MVRPLSHRLLLPVTVASVLGCTPLPRQDVEADAGRAPGPTADADISCYPRETYCVDDATALYCSPAGTLATARCDGPLGCVTGAAGVACDDSVAMPGDACGVVDHAACARDRQSALRCADDHRFATLQACSGPAGCAVASGVVRCDDSLALAGQACARAGEASCSADHQSALTCTGGAFALLSPCGGPAGCQIEGEAVYCDRRVSTRDEPCDHDGQFACSASGSSLLRCVSGHFEAINSCDGPGACTVKALTAGAKAADTSEAVGIVCDDSVAVPEEPCARDGEPACSVDGRSYLVCQGHRFARGEDCPHGGCRYDAAADSVRCDRRVVARWSETDLSSFVGTWVEHWPGSNCHDQLTIDMGINGTARVTKRDCTSNKERAPRSISFGKGVLRFEEMPSGFQYNLVNTAGELRAEEDRRESHPYRYYFTRR